MKTLFIISTAIPGLTPDLDAHAGRYVKSFTPDEGPDQLAGLVTTLLHREAMKFDSTEAAMEFWMQTSERDPVRDDGKPNRPLTLFTVTIE